MHMRQEGGPLVGGIYAEDAVETSVFVGGGPARAPRRVFWTSETLDKGAGVSHVAKGREREGIVMGQVDG